MMTRRTHHRLRASPVFLGLIVAILCAILGQVSPAMAAPQANWLSVKSPCSGDEQWGPDKNSTATYVQSHVSLSKKGGENANVGVLRALGALEKTKDDRSKMITHYWLARALFDAGEMHLAHEEFNGLLSTTLTAQNKPYALALQQGSMACLVQIHHRYPTLKLQVSAREGALRWIADADVSADQANYKDQKDFFYEALGWQLFDQLKDPQSTAKEPLLSQLSVFQGNTYFTNYAKILILSHFDQPTEILRLSAIFQDPTFATRPESERALLHLIFAHTYYGAHQYAKAIAEYKQIPKSSNYTVQELSAIAWAQIITKDYEAAIGSAENLVSGALGHTYAPEGYETLAIALFETCNVKEALQVYQHFRKKYGQSFYFLKPLQVANARFDYYKTLSNYLLKKTSMPDRIGSEWAHDPIFLANQTELNLIIDETQWGTALRAIALENLQKSRPAYWLAFNRRLDDLNKANGARQAALVQGINQALAARSQIMMGQLTHTADNLQLLEVEAYETLGDKIVAENNPNAKEPVKDRPTRKKINPEAVWDWGRVPGGITGANEEDGEVWDDEIGYLHAKIKDSCK
jgi:hypothetical protein